MPSSPPPPAPPAEAPSRWKAYVSLTKPGITGLILLMAVAGFFIALPRYPPSWVRLAGILVAGALASMGAGVLNHWYDRDLDAQMRRTRSRPLPTSVVSSRSALLFGLILTAASVPLAYLLVNLAATLAMLSGWFVYVVVYTMGLKRRTRWNIVIGGYAGSAPVLAGCAAAVGAITPAGALLALLVFLWTPPHFWSLAIALKEDYGRAELPMLPVAGDLRGSARTVVLSAALLLPVTAAFLFLPSEFLIFAIIALGLGIAFTAVTLGLLRSVERPVALRGFIASGLYLLSVAAAVVINWLGFVVGVPYLH